MTKEYIDVGGVKILVTITGEGQPILFLHGWGASHESAAEIREAAKDLPVQIIAPDLPGFGDSDEPPEAWGVEEYADVVEELVQELRMKNAELRMKNKESGIILIGHSFGGRIAIKLAARHRPWIQHLILCGAAGIKKKRYLKRTIGIMIAEAGKLLFRIPGLRSFEGAARNILYKLLRVHDYANVSGVMRETMVKVINEDLTDYLTMIDVPVDLFWGHKDKLTPIADGRFMNKKIVHSKLHEFPDVGHRVHRHKAKEIAELLRALL